MPLPNLGPEFDLAQRLTALERAVRNLGGQAMLQAASSTQSDGTVGLFIGETTGGATALIVYQGPGASTDPNTGQHPMLLYVGQLDVNGSVANSGVIASRPNGIEIMTLGDGGCGIFDAFQNLMLASDEVAGWGLRDPWIPLPTPAPATAGNWPYTTNTSWTTIASSSVVLQHPRVKWNGYGYMGAGSAQFRLLVNGQALGAVFTATNGYVPIAEEFNLLAGSQWQNGVEVDLQAQVTSGTGNAAGQVTGIYGRGQT